VYDNADQLTGGTQTDTVTSAVQSQAGYGYDLAGNRTLAQSGLVPANATYNNLNGLGSIQTGGTGQMLVQGTVNKPVTGVTVNGMTAGVSPSEIFHAQIPVQTGVNTIAVTGTDASNNQPTTKSYQVTVPGPTTRNLRSDLNGNLVSDGAGRGYVWDAENRLASITYTGSQNHTDFTYDGLSRMIKLQELNGSTVTATRQFVWDGSTIADERDASNNIVRRYFSQGEQVVQGTGAPALLYYTRDHLGTVREAIDATGALRARYDYDPYGVRSANSVTANAVETTFGYTGHLAYKNSADLSPNEVDFALFREYDATLARWFSRDPIGERGYLNLFNYAANNPIVNVDLLGLWQVTIGGGAELGGYITFGHNGGKSSFGFGVGGADGGLLDVSLGDSGSRAPNCYGGSSELGLGAMAAADLGPLSASITADAGIRELDGAGSGGVVGDDGTRMQVWAGAEGQVGASSLGFAPGSSLGGGGDVGSQFGAGGCMPSGAFASPGNRKVTPHVGLGAMAFIGVRANWEW
jgi:RHS repeat-associated protein